MFEGMKVCGALRGLIATGDYKKIPTWPVGINGHPFIDKGLISMAKQNLHFSIEDCAVVILELAIIGSCYSRSELSPRGQMLIAEYEEAIEPEATTRVIALAGMNGSTLPLMCRFMCRFDGLFRRDRSAMGEFYASRGWPKRNRARLSA